MSEQNWDNSLTQDEVREKLASIEKLEETVVSLKEQQQEQATKYKEDIAKLQEVIKGLRNRSFDEVLQDRIETIVERITPDARSLAHEVTEELDEYQLWDIISDIVNGAISDALNDATITIEA